MRVANRAENIHIAVAAFLLAGAPLALAQVPGPDRTLDAQDVKSALTRSGEVTRIAMTGGTSGRKFTMLLKPDNRLNMNIGGGRDFGRDWKIDGAKFCLRVYDGTPNQNDFKCGTIDLKEARLFWVEDSDSSRNALDSITFEKP